MRAGGRAMGVLALALIGASAMVTLGATPVGAKLSESDCDVVLGLQSSSSSSSNELGVLAAQAESFADAAKEISDKKLKKGLERLADVYEDASEAKNAAGAGLVLAKRARDYAKGFKPMAKALNECALSNLPTLPSRN